MQQAARDATTAGPLVANESPMIEAELSVVWGRNRKFRAVGTFSPPLL